MRSINYSACSRYQTDIDIYTSAAFEQRAADLTKYLVYRGYQVKFVRDQINRARVLDWEELLTPRSMATNNRIPFVVTYHPGLPNIGGILRELHPFLHYSERCNPKSLQDYLVHAKLRPLDQNPSGNRGTHKCTSNRCDVCNYLAVGDRFSSHVTGTSYTVNYRLDCNSRNVVYLISCKVCGLQYVGSTTTNLKFRLRFNNHKSRLRAHSKMSAANKDKDDAIYKHFHSDGHHGLPDVHLIDKVNAKEDLIAKEGQWAYRLRSLRPQGLNESDFFFSQNRGERIRN